MSYIKLLDVLKIIGEVMGEPHKSKMFDSQTMQASNDPSLKKQSPAQ